MPPTTSSTKLRFRRLREWISGPPTQASLFHYIRAEERAESRTRKMEAGVASLVIHALTVSLAVFFALGKLPEVISKATPHYTEEARRARTEGLVILDVVIRANGTVDGFRVIKGLGYGLDESAITTIANKWRFKPATYRGVPIDFKASIQVTFRLY